MSNDRRNADGNLVSQGLLERMLRGRDDEGEHPVVEIGASTFVSYECTQNGAAHCPYILRMVGAWADENYTYFASEYCKEGELFNRVIEKGHLAEPDARRLA